MVESIKHVRVDNWGVFFLQRLQMFFNKTDYCDLTLQFDGNVQLKVHRLVMNACTEYFQVLEQTCDVVDDSIILMPPDLQADVILPIVNFMYTGTLEYHPVIYERLIRTAELMNIPILIKLLEAHKAVPQNNLQVQKFANIPQSPKQPKRILNSQPQTKKVFNSLPNTLPGRKLPVWKRKTAPVARSTIVPRDRPVTVPSVDNMGCGATSGVGALVSAYKSRSELVHIDNEPKPTRFEWPDGEDDKIKTETYMESSAFENLTSYSSIPLIKGEDTERIPVYEELRHYASPQRIAVKRRLGKSPYTGRRPNQPSQQRQQQINVDADESSDIDDSQDPDDPDYNPDMALSTSLATTGGKRAACTSVAASGAKRSRFNEKENSSGRSKEIRAGTSKGTIDRDGEGHLNHSVLLTELLKKFPNLANTNKNIKLKIMTKSGDKHSASGSKQQTSQGKSLPCKVMVQGPKGQLIYKPKNKHGGNVVRKQLKPNTVAKKCETEGPWLCNKCEVPPDAYHLYYLYRKHMTDVHQEQFSSLMCKFCGKHTRNSRALSFHMHTVHGASLSNIIGTPFPQCDRCSFTALSERRLARHKQTHRSFHVQCMQCKVGFTGLHALATHQQITSHISRDTSLSNPGMTSYDCQYCTRHWQNCAMLFVHLRTAHREDARRDGIISIDEDPEEEDDDEVEDETMSHEDESQELEHSSAGSVMVDKVNVIADLKVAGAADEVQIQVANASIATTLGLVDIVVLDENQQYILQSTNGDLDQSEFILPQITGSFVHQGQQNSPQHQQQTTNHLTQLKQSTNQQCVGTTTTDELVMVLTDHDYNDETTDGHAPTTVDHHVQGNGNIVVLYSHPVQSASNLEGRAHVDGGGSLLVQTAEGQVLEIRNSHSDLVNHSSQQESIELIQREINNSQPQHILIQQEVSIEDEEQLHQENQDVHLQQHNPEELVEEDYQEGEQHQDNQDEHLQQHQHSEESVEEDFHDGELKEIETQESETQGDDMGFNVESGAQEEQQVMLVVAVDDESIEEASQIDQTDQSCEHLEEQQSAEAIDEHDSIVLRPEQEENIGQQDVGQDVCGLQDGTSVIAQQHEQQVPEAMEVEETEAAGDVPSQVASINNTSEELNAKSTNAETTLSYNTSHLPLKSPELPTIRAENQEAKEDYSGQYSEDITLEKNSVGDISDEQQLQSASEAVNVQESDKKQTHYSPEAMEVDCRQSMAYKENKDADTTDELDDSIVQHNQSIDEQLHQEDNENVANSTFEEDDNQGDDVIQGVSNAAESGAVQEALARNEGEEQLTNTSNNEVEEVVNDEYGTAEIISQDDKNDVENNEDPSLTLYSDDIERAMESIHSSEESTSINPSFTEVKNSKSASQNSTIALLDEWEDTEDSSSQDKNCPTVQPICQTTTSMTSAVNKLINDDWDDDE